MRGEIDLVVWWRGSTQPSSDLLKQLRLLARLAGSARRQDGGALSSLYAVARQLLASRDREEVLLGLATAAADVLDAEIAGVFLSTPDGTHLEAQAVVGHRSMATARLRLARGESMVGHVFATGEVYRSDDWTTDPVISKRLLPVATTEGTKSCIGAPMRLEGVVVGVLAAWRRRRSVYTDVDLALIATLADLAALGVARALDDDRLRDLSEQLMTANAELAQRYEGPGSAGDPPAAHARGRRRRRSRIRRRGAAHHHRSGGRLRRRRGRLRGRLAQGAHRLRRRRDRDRPKAVLLGPDGAGRQAIAVDVGSTGQRWGRLAVATGMPAATRDVVATEQAAVACALLLSRQDAAAGAMRRLESEFVWDLIDGRILDEAEAIVRSRQLTRELPAAARVVLVSAAGAARGGRQAGAPERIDAVRRLVRDCARLLAEHGMHALVGGRGETLVMIIPDRPPDAVRTLGHAVCSLGGERGSSSRSG